MDTHSSSLNNAATSDALIESAQFIAQNYILDYMKLWSEETGFTFVLKLSLSEEQGNLAVGTFISQGREGTCQIEGWIFHKSLFAPKNYQFTFRCLFEDKKELGHCKGVELLGRVSVQKPYVIQHLSYVIRY